MVTRTIEKRYREKGGGGGQLGILDIGVSGEVAKELKSKYPGIHMSGVSIEKIDKKYLEYLDSYRSTLVEKINPLRVKFDVIIDFAGADFYSSQPTTIRSMVGLLRKGGTLIIHSVESGARTKLLDALKGKGVIDWRTVTRDVQGVVTMVTIEITKKK